ncbi:MAG: hypothetical protein J7L23_03695 [Candidatus Diapherotrites archaeon]|nr:hypothetical protein [Candidatus Diapherotrites archaeon]
MKRILLVILLLVTIISVSKAEENITLDTAMRKAVLTFPDLPTTPKSSPSNMVVVDGERYWVVEFDVSSLKQVWVPVRYSDGKLVLTNDSLLRKIYLIHLTLKRIAMQSDSKDYPTGKKLELNGFLGEVKRQQDFIETYSSLLPDSLAGKANTLLAKTKSLKSSVETAISLITKLDAMEERLMGTPASEDDVSAWKGNFSALLTIMAQIPDKGDEYETERKDFVRAANAILSNATNDSATSDNIHNFLQGVGITGISSLPGLKTTANDWRMTFLDVQLSNESLANEVNQLISHYKEEQSEETISDLQKSVEAKIKEIDSSAPPIIARLYSCTGDLDSEQLQKLDILNRTYHEAINSFNKGSEYYRNMDYTKARNSYLNAREYANDATEKASKLSGVKCRNKPPATTSITKILTDFVKSPTGWIAILLVIVLIALIWWNKRKEEGYDEDEGSYYSLPRY